MQKLAIIGGSGFIGSYITRKFLEGNFEVSVSANDTSHPERYAHLLHLPGSEKLTILPLDVQDKKQLRNFISDCEIVIHCGTPFKLEVENPQKELFEPIVEGTRNFLEVLQESASVKKVVFVASVAAHNAAFPLAASTFSSDHLYTEDDEAYVDNACHPYAVAKHQAYLMVRKFIREQTDLHFDFVSLSPTAVMGSALSDRQDSTSIGLQYHFKNSLKPNPFVKMLFDEDIHFSMVDVQDVAEAAFQAARRSGLHGKTYLLNSESWRVSDIHRMLNAEQAIHDSKLIYSNMRACEELGLEFKPVRLSLQNYALTEKKLVKQGVS